MKTYTFYDEGYYDQPGCSCCEGIYMECYNSGNTDCNLGSAHSHEHCYFQAILTELGVENTTGVVREALYCMPLRDLKQTAKDLGIKVEVIS